MANPKNNEVIIVKDLALKLWGSLKSNEFIANWKWLSQVHHRTKEGGLWIYPNMGLIFKKAGNGFIECK